MANINVKVGSNVKEVKKALNEVAEKVLTMWGMQAESAVKELCPVDTGLLRNSITWAIAGKGADTTTYEAGGKSGSYSGQAQEDKGGPRHVYVGTNVEYAIEQELGSYKHEHGQSPYLRPGIEGNKEYFRTILETELKNALQS